MAFARNAGFTSAIADDPAATAAGEVTPTRYNLPFVVSGADVGGIPYCPTATTEVTSANLLYTETSGPRLQVGSGSTTSQGFIFGYTGSSGVSGFWSTGVTLASDNYLLTTDNSNLNINAPISSGQILFRIQNTLKAGIRATDGEGVFISAGTATTDVAALSITRTNNNAAVATGVKWTFTDTTSAAGFLPFQILGTSSGAANLFKVTKDGLPIGGAAILIGTTTALTDGAGAGAGTILNAPAAGNPTKWVPIDDNGTTRYIPAW